MTHNELPRTQADEDAEHWEEVAALEGGWDSFNQPGVNDNGIASEEWRKLEERNLPEGSDDTADRYDAYSEERDNVEEDLAELEEDRQRNMRAA